MHNMARIIDRGTLNVSIHFSIGANFNFCVFIHNDVHQLHQPANHSSTLCLPTLTFLI